MNILPFVISLIMILLLITVEKLEVYKSKEIVQNIYLEALKTDVNEAYNTHQKNMSRCTEPFSHRQTTLRGFLNKKEREQLPEKYNAYTFVAVNLINKLYGQANFFIKAKSERPNIVSELLSAIQTAADNSPEGSIKKIEDIYRLNLNDKQLQEVFYKMLKGSVEKEKYKKVDNSLKGNPKKTYFPLLTFFNFNGLDKKIAVRLAPKELLIAIYGNETVADEIIEARQNLSRELKKESSTLTNQEAKIMFSSQFEAKEPAEVKSILDYTISTSTQLNRK